MQDELLAGRTGAFFHFPAENAEPRPSAPTKAVDHPRAIDIRLLVGRTTVFLAGAPSCPLRVERPAMDNSASPVFYAVIPVAGQVTVEHLGGEYRVRPGQMTLCTTSRTAVARYAGGEQVFMVFLCGGSRELPATTADAVLGRVLELDGIGELLVTHLHATMRTGPRLSAVALDVAASVAGDLLRATLVVKADELPSDSDAAWRTRIDTYIESRLNDPSLGVHMIAAAHHMSVRTVYRLFERTGESVHGYIRRRRLERFRIAIQAQPDVSMSAVCVRYGLDPKHLSRQYRAFFGELPSETRRELSARSRS
jgi:AraC-like DNA-binding protein